VHEAAQRTAPAPAVHDRARLLADVLQGLLRPQKQIACKYFYDAAGSQLFERICELPEYYLTRTELAIMTGAADEIAAALGARTRLVEFGSGSSTKTRLLLDRLAAPTAYVPVDISAHALAAAVAALRRSYPRLPVEPRSADYTRPFALPPAPAGTERTICYFPGSTIGNFTDDEACSFLRRVAAVCGPRGGLLVGVDLQKDLGVLLPAYDDAAGVTAAFNKNLLHRLCRELDADVDADCFEHRAIWDGAAGRIEMQLVSRCEQTIRVGGIAIPFRRGEILTTEYSHKYTLPGFAALAARGGFAVARVWTDPRQWFSVQLLISAYALGIADASRASCRP
jgi:dimethylhistidine N-methyltransferase